MAAPEDRSDTLQAAPDLPKESQFEPRDGGPAEAASFIAGSAAELAQLARRHRLNMLGHLLDMAQMEADQFVSKQLGRGRV